MIYADLAFIAGVESVCETCHGKRFTDEALRHRLRRKSIAEIYDFSVEEASDFFTGPSVLPTLRRLRRVGLDYLELGQRLTTLSGGERQRLKLAIEVAADADILVLDEPTSGLHMADTDRLISLLDEIVDTGRTMIVIEHNLDVISRADWIIDVGPGAGRDGGHIVHSGTPRALLTVHDSRTLSTSRCASTRSTSRGDDRPVSDSPCRRATRASPAGGAGSCRSQAGLLRER